MKYCSETCSRDTGHAGPCSDAPLFSRTRQIENLIAQWRDRASRPVMTASESALLDWCIQDLDALLTHGRQPENLG
jgi:hypothetical protein